MLRTKVVFALLLVTTIISGCGTKETATTSEYSGFIGDYEGLEATRDEVGDDVLRWKSSDIEPGTYKKLMVDPIVFYPEPKPTPQVSAELLMKIGEYANEVLLREVGKVVPLVDQPGPDVLRMRVAITGISTHAEGLKAYEYIPIAAVVASASTAAGTRDREAALVAETELVDSMTGKRVFIEVWKKKAKNLLENDSQQLTLEDVRDIIDAGGEVTRLMIENLVNN